jgi:hypothetical protein
MPKDNIEALLTNILARIAGSKLPDDVKADLYTRVEIGMHSLVWPILLSHIPKEKLDETILHSDHLTTDQYLDLITIALVDKSTMKELYTEIKAALEEVAALIEKNIPAIS